MASVPHDCARIDLVAEPGCDCGPGEFVKLKFAAPELALHACDAIFAPAALDAGAAGHTFHHDQQLLVRVPFGRWHDQILLGLNIFPGLKFSQEIKRNGNISWLVVLDDELVFRCCALEAGLPGRGCC